LIRPRQHQALSSKCACFFTFCGVQGIEVWAVHGFGEGISGFEPGDPLGSDEASVGSVVWGGEVKGVVEFAVAFSEGALIATWDGDHDVGGARRLKAAEMAAFWSAVGGAMGWGPRSVMRQWAEVGAPGL
jgi:hypothetical protein